MWRGMKTSMYCSGDGPYMTCLITLIPLGGAGLGGFGFADSFDEAFGPVVGEAGVGELNTSTPTKMRRASKTAADTATEIARRRDANFSMDVC